MLCECRDMVCWATTMCFMKLKIWNIFLHSHNPQRVCSIPLCKWAWESYSWEFVKAEPTFNKKIKKTLHMLRIHPLNWLQWLDLSLSELPWQYEWAITKSMHVTELHMLFLAQRVCWPSPGRSPEDVMIPPGLALGELTDNSQSQIIYSGL